MKNLNEITMVWNYDTNIANYDFADVVGHTQEEVRDEVMKRFGPIIKQMQKSAIAHSKIKSKTTKTPAKVSYVKKRTIVKEKE